MKRVLLEGAHPDDIAILHDQFAVSAQEQGAELFAAVATDGERSTINHKEPDFLYRGGRRGEERSYLEFLGVPAPQQYYLGQIDRQLDERFANIRLKYDLLDIVTENDIDTIVTAGREGFDLHPDHMTMHQAGVWVAQRILEETGDAPDIYALNRQGQGGHRLPVHRPHKQAGAAFHGSQYTPYDLDLRNPDSVLKNHRPLFRIETYDILRGENLRYTVQR